MKFIHLSDLHIGKRVHEVSLLEEQKYILKQIIDIIQKENIENVLIAGDIYDKTIPSAEAVRVLDKFLTELVKLKVRTFIINGNHDSAERMAFGASIMKENNVYISPVYDGNIESILLTDEYGNIKVHLLPFLKPAIVRNALKNEESEMKIETYNEAVKVAVEKINIDTNERNIILVHQFVVGASTCESEGVSVGGIEQVSADIFSNFDYVALGHIHTPQNISNEENPNVKLRYCGTPLKYSFSEANQEKSVTIIDIKEKGNINISTIPLVPKRDMRKIKGTYQEVTNLANVDDKEKMKDYVSVTLTDEEDIIDGIHKLRSFYPNIMLLEYENLRSKMEQEIKYVEQMDKKTELEIFEEFYEKQNNQEISEEQREYLKKLIENLMEEAN